MFIKKESFEMFQKGSEYLVCLYTYNTMLTKAKIWIMNFQMQRIY